MVVCSSVSQKIRTVPPLLSLILLILGPVLYPQELPSPRDTLGRLEVGHPLPIGLDLIVKEPPVPQALADGIVMWLLLLQGWTRI